MQFAKLKLVSAVRSRKSVVDIRRDKLLSKLDEQIEFATEMAEGGQCGTQRLREVIGTDGRREIKPIRVKRWWWRGHDGKLLFAVQYGTKALELAKGKSAIEVGSAQELIEALQCVRDAAAAGELDAQIGAASSALRTAFKRG